MTIQCFGFCGEILTMIVNRRCLNLVVWFLERTLHPCMECQFAAQENARRNQDTYPLAAETVLKSTYMDDSIDSVESKIEEEGIELYRQLNGLWSLAGMQARKWISNSPKVSVAATPEEDRATELKLNDGQDPVIKTLGIVWDSKEDVLTISTSAVSSETPLTKRNVLKKIATV